MKVPFSNNISDIIFFGHKNLVEETESENRDNRPTFSEDMNHKRDKSGQIIFHLLFLLFLFK